MHRSIQLCSLGSSLRCASRRPGQNMSATYFHILCAWYDQLVQILILNQGLIGKSFAQLIQRGLVQKFLAILTQSQSGFLCWRQFSTANFQQFFKMTVFCFGAQLFVTKLKCPEELCNFQAVMFNYFAATFNFAQQLLRSCHSGVTWRSFYRAGHRECFH